MSTNNRHPWQSQKGDSIALIVSQLRELNTPLFNNWNVPAQFNLKRRIYELEA